MNRKALLTLDFLLCFLAFVAVICLHLGLLNSFEGKASSSLDFLQAKSKALECSFGIDSLAANTAFSISSKGFDCFADSNNSIASFTKARKAVSFTIAKAKISTFESGTLMEVEASEHYK